MKGFRSAALLIAAFGLCAETAFARKFDYNDGVVGAYVGGTIGLNRLQKTPFEPGKPTTVSYPDFGGINYGYSGMLGLNLTLKNRLSIKVGVELLYSSKAKDMEGKNSSGAVLFSETSESLGVNPEMMIEINVVRGTKHRVSVGGGAGYLTGSIRNDVKMTAAGQTQLGVGNYIEEGQGTGISAKVFSNFEFVLLDNISMVLQLGYRYARVGELKYTRDANLPAPFGAVTKGQTMRNNDGSNRIMDMSGPFAGAQFVFWMW